MSRWIPAETLGVAAVGMSFLATKLVRAYAMNAGVIDQPNARSSHSVPTPRGGGLGILASATAGVVMAGLFGLVRWPDALTLGVGAWTLAVVGWIDDHRSLRAATRLAVQILIAAWTVYQTGGLPAVRLGTWTVHLGAAGSLVAVIGLVWSINLFNFMDGIDALAGSQACLIFGTVSLLLLRLGDVSLGLISLLLAAAALGFLPWNWPRAKIFLGDVGSGPIGYLIAAVAIASENRGEVPLLVVVLVSAAFIADATVTLLRRLARGERLSQAHRSHAYQRLAARFKSHGLISLGAGIETLLFAGLGAAVTITPDLFVPAAAVVTAVLAATLLYAERRAPMRPPSALSAAP